MKQYKLDPKDIKRISPLNGYCLATDKITIDGNRVGYMYKELPNRPDDTGWRFFSGIETQEYANNPNNLQIYDINTICNYDPDIIEFLDAPNDSQFERNTDGKFVSVKR